MTDAPHTSAPHTAAWFDLSSPDAPRARAFYGELFGWPVQVLDETYALVGDDGSGRPTGGIGQAGPDAPYTGFAVYFRVPDLDAALEHAVRLGGARRLEPQPVPGGDRLAVFTDPDGNAVGLLGK